MLQLDNSDWSNYFKCVCNIYSSLALVYPI